MDHEGILEKIKEQEEILQTSVKISWVERDKLIVKRLIEIRNSEVNRNYDMSHFDKVIRHFLSKDEFQKYVIDKQNKS